MPPHVRLLRRDALGLVATAAGQVEEGRGELVRPDARTLRDERRHEGGVELGGRLLLVLAVVADLELAAVEAVDAVDERHRRHEPEERSRRSVRGRLSTASSIFSRSCSASWPTRPPRATILAKPLPLATRIPAVDVNAERGISARSSTHWFGGMSIARRTTMFPSILTSPRTWTGRPHARRITPGGQERRLESREPGLPLVAPDPKVHVDDVVVGDGEPAQAVVDVERALLRLRGVVPDDPHTVRQELRAERAGCARRPELGGGAGAVRAPVLADADLVDRLTVAQRDLAERAGEVAVEGERDRFVDDERPVLTASRRPSGVGEGEALRVRSGRDD